MWRQILISRYIVSRPSTRTRVVVQYIKCCILIVTVCSRVVKRLDLRRRSVKPSCGAFNDSKRIEVCDDILTVGMSLNYI